QVVIGGNHAVAQQLRSHPAKPGGARSAARENAGERGMTAAAAAPIAATGTEYRRAITAGVIGHVLEWYDFGAYGSLVPTISALFFPGGDPMVSLLSTF